MFSKLIKQTTQIIIAGSIVIATVNSFAQSEMKIYTHAPPPDELADTLFPKRYRGIVINEDNTIPAKPLPNNSALSYQQPKQQANMFGLLINFEYDSTNIVAPSLPLLDSVGQMLKLEKTAGRTVIIEGHADSTGSHDYNQGLSERRARAIRRYLVSVFNIDPTRLVVIGKGEQELHDKYNPANPINRRVVFKPLNQG